MRDVAWKPRPTQDSRPPGGGKAASNGLAALQGNLLPRLYIVLTASKPCPATVGGCILGAGAPEGGHHERYTRQGAKTWTSCHLGRWHGTGAESSTST